MYSFIWDDDVHIGPCPNCGYNYENKKTEEFKQLSLPFPEIHIDLDVRDPKNLRSIRKSIV